MSAAEPALRSAAPGALPMLAIHCLLFGTLLVAGALWHYKQTWCSNLEAFVISNT
jgi:hypothetical protein